MRRAGSINILDSKFIGTLFRMIIYDLIGNRNLSIKKLCKAEKRQAKVIGLGMGNV